MLNFPSCGEIVENRSSVIFKKISNDLRALLQTFCSIETKFKGMVGNTLHFGGGVMENLGPHPSSLLHDDHDFSGILIVLKVSHFYRWGTFISDSESFT